MIFNYDVSDITTDIGDVSTLTTSATNLASAVNELDSDKMEAIPQKIELIPASGTTNGGYIDFHYGGDSGVDYTSRIIESSSGVLNISGSLTLGSALPVASGGTGNTSVDTTPTQNSTKMVTSGGVYTAINNKMDTIPTSIEINPGANATNGGFIDFHYAGSTADYTSRIIEYPSGYLNIIANIRVNGLAPFSTSTETTEALNIPANTQVTGTLSISKANYYPLGIVGITCTGTGNSGTIVQRFRISGAAAGSGTIDYAIRNITSSAISSNAITFYVLWTSML